MSSLAEELQAQNKAGRGRLPCETVELLDAATAEVAASGVAEASCGVGAVIADFALPDANGKLISLSSLLAQGPVVLSFYRGGWCPYCSTELRALQGVLAEIQAAGATLVAVSPQTPDSSLSTAEKLDLAFPVLSDLGNRVAETLGLVFRLPEPLRAVYRGFGNDLSTVNGDESFRLPIPATYVLAADGTLVWRFVDPDYTKRAEPAAVLAALAAL